MNALALIALTAILSYGVFFDGGGYRPQWLHCLVAFGVLTVVYSAGRVIRPGIPPRSDRRVWLLFAVVFLVCGFQLLPLPAGLLRILSPGSLELYQPALAQLGTPQAIPISVVPAATFRLTLNLLAYIAVFFIVTDLAARWTGQIWTLALPIVLIGGLEAAVGILQIFYGDPKAAVSGTFANRDHFAGLLELCLPFAVMLPVAVWRRKGKEPESSLESVVLCCVLGVIATVILIGIVNSLSRMGFVAALMSLLVIAVLTVGTDRSGRLRWKPALGFALLILLCFFLLPSNAFIARFGGAISAAELSADLRWRIWGDTFQLWRQFPVFGCGFGAFQSALMRYQTGAPMFTINFVHNDYLQFLTELGAAGFLPLVAIAILLFRMIVKRLRDSASEYQRCFYIACIGSITAITIHSFVDFNLYKPATASMLCWISAMAAAPASSLVERIVNSADTRDSVCY
jgi:O-antigen ligase